MSIVLHGQCVAFCLQRQDRATQTICQTLTCLRRQATQSCTGTLDWSSRFRRRYPQRHTSASCGYKASEIPSDSTGRQGTARKKGFGRSCCEENHVDFHSFAGHSLDRTSVHKTTQCRCVFLTSHHLNEIAVSCAVNRHKPLWVGGKVIQSAPLRIWNDGIGRAMQHYNGAFHLLYHFSIWERIDKQKANASHRSRSG